ncbi:unnamed protein product [Parnassius apollo]|uniref:(apollo) hypothetical protein n=1 Tax=Parnassius apollo TaxID=110799 RepID=A0A8S3XTU6_PARAO|nr:unnamed protein product [Parnassius apollo]
MNSYHGEYILKKVSKILQKPAPSTVTSSMSVLGEQKDTIESSKPNDTFEIIVKEGVKLASDYLKLLKDLLESEKEMENHQSNASDDGDAEEFNKRYLILISTVMTWALTKPLDPETPDMPFIETDFRKRKPHPNYKQHYCIENEVIGIAKKYKSRIGAVVVASGLTYGGREDPLFYWFQKAWECEPFLPILGRGGNVIPLISVLDLAEIICNLIKTFPRKLYILAVEQNITKQREIIKPLGRLVGSGMFKCIPPEDAFLIPEIDQRTYDFMTVNLNMEPTFIVDKMGLQWTSELTFAENVPILMKQFKKERGLKSFKVLIYGPPLIGKTTLSKLICEAYGLVYISQDTIVEDILKDLERRVNHWKEGETAALHIPNVEDDNVIEDEEDEEEDENEKETARMTLGILLSGHPLNEEEMIGYLRQKLLSHEAQNRGWVLDGFPTNLAECTALFEKGNEEDTEDSEINDSNFEEDADLYSNVLKKILPDVVVSLEATDDFICEKAMNQPESDARFDENTVLKHLREFRVADAPDVTPLNFFDELGIHPLVVQVNDHNDYSMKGPYADVSLRMGRPCRYGKLLELIEMAEKREKAEKELLHAKQEKALQELKRKMKDEHEEKMEYWSELYGLMREEEEAALAAAGEPMRNYLVQYIFPTLTAGLLEVAKLRPDDPIDFLAEYLFKLNPTGKMLEPGYNLKAEKILGKIKILDDALKDLDIKIDPLMPPELEIDANEASTSKRNINSMSAF